MDIKSDFGSLWFTFLQVRAHLVDEWHTEGRTDSEIAASLSMDRTQVALIRQRGRFAPFDGKVILAESPAPLDLKIAPAQPGEDS